MKKESKQKKIPKQITQKDFNLLIQLIFELETENIAQEFLVPIDMTQSKSIVVQYKREISKPVDFLTIKKRLKANSYNSIKDVYNDVMLIWENCVRYNEDNSNIYNNAMTLKEKSKELFGIYFPEFLGKKRGRAIEDDMEDSVESSDKITLLEKCLMKNKIEELDKDAISKVITFIDKEFKECLIAGDWEFLKINIDKMKKPFYQRLMAFIEDLQQKKEKLSNKEMEDPDLNERGNITNNSTSSNNHKNQSTGKKPKSKKDTKENTLGKEPKASTKTKSKKAKETPAEQNKITSHFSKEVKETKSNGTKEDGVNSSDLENQDRQEKPKTPSSISKPIAMTQNNEETEFNMEMHLDESNDGKQNSSSAVKSSKSNEEPKDNEHTPIEQGTEKQDVQIPLAIPKCPELPRLNEKPIGKDRRSSSRQNTENQE